MSDTIIAGGTTYTGVPGIKATDSNDNTLTFIRPSGTKSITQNGTGIDVTEYAAVDVAVSGGITPPSGMEIGTITPESDSLTLTINHSLGVVPKWAYILAAVNGSYDDLPSRTGSTLLSEEISTDPETGVFDITLNTNHCRNTVVSYNSTGPAFFSSPTYTAYPATMTSSSVTFATGRYYSATFRAGVTYLYVFMK